MNNRKSKKVLLIGKYPPMQGGVAAKTFWLYKKLAQTGFAFRVVTIESENYSVPVKKDDIKVFSVDITSVPWHIPNSNLYFDRLLNKCFEALDNFTPDIIETNYLWPFCGIAIHLSKILNKPLLIRHAGSDILKFNTDNEFRNIMKRYFEQAAIIVTNNTSMEIVSELCYERTKIRLMDRYSPDPEYFCDMKYTKQYDILFAGKINHHWKLKGISHLLEHIKTNKLHALFLCDGNYIENIYSLIRDKGLDNNIEIEKFVHPSEMPETISKCKSVWCWNEEGSIDDFSNIIWETCYCKILCILNSNIERKNELKQIVEIFPDLVNFLSFDNLDKLSYHNKSNYNSEGDLDNLKNIYESYVLQNINIYKALL